MRATHLARQVGSLPLAKNAKHSSSLFILGRAVASLRQRRRLPPLIWRCQSTLADLLILALCSQATVSTADADAGLLYCERYTYANTAIYHLLSYNNPSQLTGRATSQGRLHSGVKVQYTSRYNTRRMLCIMGRA